MTELDQLVNISKYAGGRFDLVQAGGGNSSVKCDNGTMLIKSSGFLLSDIERDKGYSTVDNSTVTAIMTDPFLRTNSDKKAREGFAATKVQEATLEGNRASIETLLHSMMQKYTLHTHPVAVNAVTCRKDYREILTTLFDTCLIVPYETPGIELAVILHDAYNDFVNRNGIKPSIIFLQNHGLIVTSDQFQEIERLTEEVLEKIEQFLKADFSNYKLTTRIARLVNAHDEYVNIAMLSEDKKIYEILVTDQKSFFNRPFCPDTLVFCGVQPLQINTLDDHAAIDEYKTLFFELPKIILFDNKVFIIARNLKKAKEIEDVLKFHLLALQTSKTEQINFLPDEELAYLGNWEAEKYRQNK